MFQLIPVFSTINAVSQNLHYIHNREIPFFGIVIPDSADFILVKELYLVLFCHNYNEFNYLENLPVGGAVEGAVADGFGDVAAEDRGADGFFGRHGGGIVEVGDGAGYAENAVEGTG